MLADSLQVQADGTIAVNLSRRSAALIAASVAYGCPASLEAVAEELERRALNAWMKERGEPPPPRIQVPPWDGYWFNGCYIGSLPLLDR